MSELGLHPNASLTAANEIKDESMSIISRHCLLMGKEVSYIGFCFRANWLCKCEKNLFLCEKGGLHQTLQVFCIGMFGHLLSSSKQIF